MTCAGVENLPRFTCSDNDDEVGEAEDVDDTDDVEEEEEEEEEEIGVDDLLEGLMIARVLLIRGP